MKAVLSAQLNAFVYAGARDPDGADALKALVQSHPGRLEIVKCVSGEAMGNRVFAERIREKHRRLDVVIANAGTLLLYYLFVFSVNDIVCRHIEMVRARGRDTDRRAHSTLFGVSYPYTSPPDFFLTHLSCPFLKVNTAGIVALFQAVYSLLKASKNPKFIPISTHAASMVLTLDTPAGYTSYGASKAALNWIARKIHFENEWLGGCLI